jgi:hypothetical protein
MGGIAVPAAIPRSAVDHRDHLAERTDDLIVYRTHDEDHLVGSGSAKIYPLESSRGMPSEQA